MKHFPIKFLSLFIVLITITSCDFFNKKKNTNETEPTEIEETVEEIDIPEPEIQKEELIIVLKNPDNTTDAKELITNSGLIWEKLILDKEALKIALIKVPADKKDFWKQKLSEVEEFESVNDNKKEIIDDIIEEAENGLFKLIKTPCYGECPTYEVKIDKEGNVTFIGKSYVLVKGKTEFKLTDEEFTSLKEKLAKSNFSSYKRSYGNNKDLKDLPTTIVIHNKKRIKIRLWKSVPDNLIDITEFLDGILLAKKLYR